MILKDPIRLHLFIVQVKHMLINVILQEVPVVLIKEREPIWASHLLWINSKQSFFNLFHENLLRVERFTAIYVFKETQSLMMQLPSNFSRRLMQKE